MTAVNPPSFLQYGSHSAISDRLTVASLLQPGATPMASRGGVRMSGDNASLKVAPQGTPNNTVTVASGTAFVPEADGQGVYVCHNDAPVTLTIANASTTQNRRDLIVAQVFDQEVSGTNNNWAINVITGTATSGTATAPAVPTNAIALGEVNVPAGTTTAIGTSAITDRRVTAAAAGGILPATSTALPANPYDKMAVYCEDDDTIRIWKASANAWRVQSMYPLPGPSVVYHPAATQSISATAGFTTLPSRQYIDFTAAKAMLVELHLAAWLNSTFGADLRATIGLTGATTGPGTAGAILNNTIQNYGDVLYTSQMYGQCSITVPYQLAAGTTRVEVLAVKGSTSANPSLNYAVLRVTPLRYV